MLADVDARNEVRDVASLASKGAAAKFSSSGEPFTSPEALVSEALADLPEATGDHILKGSFAEPVCSPTLTATSGRFLPWQYSGEHRGKT